MIVGLLLLLRAKRTIVDDAAAIIRAMTARAETFTATEPTS